MRNHLYRTGTKVTESIRVSFTNCSLLSILQRGKVSLKVFNFCLENASYSAMSVISRKVKNESTLVLAVLWLVGTLSQIKCSHVL